MVELEAVISRAAPGRIDKWWAEVRETLRSLDRAIEIHAQATEEPGGLFEQVRMQAPRLAGKIDRLVQEHEDIRQRIRSLVEGTGPVGDDEEAWVEQVREDVLELLRVLSRHRQRGADLLYEAYDVDLGPGD